MSEVQPKSEPTPLETILDKRGEGDGVQPSPVQADISGPAGDGSADRETPSEWHVKNLSRALKEERTKRQAFAQRVRELEDENRVLLDAPHAPREEEEAPASPHEQALFKTTMRASQAEFIAEHGKDRFNELDAVLGRAIQSGHPDIPALAAAYRKSDHPHRLVMDWAQHNGLIGRQAAPAPVFPSNFANARNVGARNGPAWSGPMPLADIFNRSRK